MNHDKVIDKIKKLLRLAESADVNEAATAAGQAQRLMEQYRIDQAILSVDEDAPDGAVDEENIKEFSDEPLAASGRLAQWKSSLGVAIASINGCRCVLSKEWSGRKFRTTLCLVGHPSDVATVRYLFAYLVSEIERLCKERNNGRGRTWANSFRIGAVHTVRKRLQEAKEQARLDARKKLKGNTKALARISKALERVDARAGAVDLWMKDNLEMTTGRSRASSRDWDAYREGKRAGESIDLSGPSGGKAGRKALKSGN